ncbi:relaxase/mobilization nuclease domain-containing protein (plasmid) [Moraxella bovis]|uniref:relaxase/mobilization nuclease domain-containing protein n=1 Tax=Moraxella bovis TaxID=476 RepID=UPI002225DBDE|nr:relaxase/mobilization nuclease domain-containing protein [Moraxella bovis]UZA07610.1 relaxase/mobilization nuclease domain-containing protein [Moraxella bovis]UZA13005.1 relaxase/mobilization nuclease domain-containing protein [Moraxella bovis]
MLVKFFKQGLKGGGNTSSKSVKDYLLDNRANQGVARIIRGDEMHTSRQIDLLDCANASSTYTSGCLSFDESETLDEKQKQELMVSFEEALLPNFDVTRYACYWVEHTDKGRLELNFVFAKVDLQTGKHLDVYQQRRDVTRLNYWKEIQLQKYGLSDPNAPKHERDFLITPFKKPDGSTPHDKFKQKKRRDSPVHQWQYHQRGCHECQ